jgi:predicted acylesterase/phospholipase RssA
MLALAPERGWIMTDRINSDADFANPSAACDIIMKGGITSGVVYPLAITELAKRYRFANIGGTSAGAIAAAAAAAAEYGRNIPGKGFMRLSRLPEEAGQILFSLFQPTRTVRPLFQILVAALNSKSKAEQLLKIPCAAIWGFRWLVLLFALPGVVIAYIACRQSDIGFLVFGALAAVVGLVIGVIYGLLQAVMKHLPDNNFGLCSGIRQPGFKGPGFTDWLADLIDDTAGRDPARDPPLTFGDLASPSGNRPRIELRMMTTNLALCRPYTLPFDNQLYAFKRQDFEKIFPPRIMKYLVDHSTKVVPEAGEEGDYYRFPLADNLPVVVAARMSLSFPLLISAIPLYARDYTMVGDEAKKLRCCLFSDGGLSSNFPIHFFDSLLPNTPTFGISLDAYDCRRDRSRQQDSSGSAAPDNLPGEYVIDGHRETRVWMPKTKQAQSGLLLPIQKFDGLFGFLMQLVYAAKDWQDNLQSTLVGSRDRIVHIFLKPEEGGLNINMSSALVGALGGYGADAGDLLRDSFDLDEHRWRRFLVAMDRLDQAFENFTAAYDGQPLGPESFKKFLSRYPDDPNHPDHPLTYRQEPRDLDLLRERAAKLAALGAEWRAQPQIPEKKLPKSRANIHITPEP